MAPDDASEDVAAAGGTGASTRDGAYLAVCGHTNIDVQIRVEELPKDGQSTPVVGRRTVYGGTACNIARHAAGLGVPVRLWSRVGDDFPADWRDGLRADGVDLGHLDVVDGALTPTCYILTDLVDRQAFCMDQGPMDQMVAHPPQAGLLEGITWLHLGTGKPQAYQALAEEAGRRGIKVAFDPGQELRFNYDTRSFEVLLDACDLFFCNQHELEVALRFLRYGDAEQLLDHVDAVVVTRGGGGASLYRSGHKPHHAKATQDVRVVDPTGAGDALRAGWYAALRAGKELEEALAWGQAAAAVAVQHEGPQTYVVRNKDIAARLTAA